MTVGVPMPPMAHQPERHSKETDAAYAGRVYRWRVWLQHEPRPDLWYAEEQEVQAYRAWAKHEIDPA